MVSKIISSVQNPLVKYLCKLKVDKKFREENGKVLVIGKREIEEVLKEHEPEQIFVPESSQPSFKNVTHCSSIVLKKITGLKNLEPCALFNLPKQQNLVTKNKLLLCDHIQDPGNLGTLIRTAYFLGFEGVLLFNTVDLFNDKTVKVSKGASLLLPFCKVNESSLDQYLTTKKIIVADLGGKDIESVFYKEPIVLVLGHETKGPSELFSEYQKITIKNQNSFDSLNVAAAGAILMHEMMRKL